MRDGEEEEEEAAGDGDGEGKLRHFWRTVSVSETQRWDFYTPEGGGVRISGRWGLRGG